MEKGVTKRKFVRATLKNTAVIECIQENLLETATTPRR
jgi:hypothetical protein